MEEIWLELKDGRWVRLRNSYRAIIEELILEKSDRLLSVEHGEDSFDMPASDIKRILDPKEIAA